jgi:hypothetical protein
VQATLSENDLYTSVGTSGVNLGTIPASAQATALYTVTLASSTPNSHAVEFTLDLTGVEGSAQVKFILPVGSLQMLPVTLVTDSGSVAPGNTAKLRPLLFNAGLASSQGLSGTLTCMDPVVTISTGSVAFPVIQPGSSGLAGGTFSVQIAASTLPGRQIILSLALTTTGGYTQSVNFPVQLGTPVSTDPLGPDVYGYFAYDNTDTAYTEAPDFAWIELDPRYGAPAGADLYLMDDDVNETITLPFTFTYYGLSFDTLTICSNGFVNFGRTWMSDFRNWNLPSSLGPPSLIAPFWDDLKADTTDGDNWIHVLSRYDQAEGRFVVEWSRTVNRRFYDEDTSHWKEETFELVLFDPAVHSTATGDGEFLFQYLMVNDVDYVENYCSVGMEDHTHQRGLQYSFSQNLPTTAAPLATGRAVKFTTNPPVQGSSQSGSTGNLISKLSFDSPMPNPANPGTVLSFMIPSSGLVRVELYDLMGRRVSSLLEAEFAAGSHLLTVDGTKLANGIYFAVLRYEGQALTRKILFLK